jgi:hypothetical protein
MADEASIRSSLQISKGNLEYQSKPTQFNVDVSGTDGPTPGAVSIATAGTDIDLSELTTPGLCRLMNLDATNYVEYGIWDGTTFHELGEIGPGETYVLKLSRNIGDGVGTDYENLRLKANTAACVVIVEAFEA